MYRLPVRRTRVTCSTARPHAARRTSVRLTQRAVAAAALLTLATTRAWASGNGATMPWDGPLQALLDNLSGPTAKVLVLLAIVGTGLFWAFTRHEEGLKKVSQIAFGGAVALGAVTMLSSLGITAGAGL